MRARRPAKKPAKKKVVKKKARIRRSTQWSARMGRAERRTATQPATITDVRGAEHIVRIGRPKLRVLYEKKK